MALIEWIDGCHLNRAASAFESHEMTTGGAAVREPSSPKMTDQGGMGRLMEVSLINSDDGFLSASHASVQAGQRLRGNKAHERSGNCGLG